jgi:hypothetical protein
MIGKYRRTGEKLFRSFCASKALAGNKISESPKRINQSQYGLYICCANILQRCNLSPDQMINKYAQAQKCN